MLTRQNHYEEAFEAYLSVNGIEYVRVSQESRFCGNGGKLKSFDYLLKPRQSKGLIVELKGRTFRGSTLEGLRGLQTWVGSDDIEGLSNWLALSDQQYRAGFVFAYFLESSVLDDNEPGTFEYADRNYAFYWIEFSRYRRAMKIRSRSWRTVYLSAEDFRASAVQMDKILFKAVETGEPSSWV